MAKVISMKPKKKFDWERWKNRTIPQVVHCETEHEANTFKMMLHEHGLCWDSYDRYDDLTIGRFRRYGEKTCYSNLGMFGNIEFYNKDGYEIHKFSAYDFD